MTTYSINAENNIVAGVVADGENTQQFATQKELAKLAAEWPMARLVDIWNSFAGVAPFDDLKPVKKFQTREIAVNRIWAAITRLDKATAPNVESEPGTSNGEPKARSSKQAAAKPAKKAAAKKRAPRTRARAGLTYEREYKGKKYLLTSSADKDGKVTYKLRGGEAFDSLTAAAKAITEYPSISGPAFWGEGTGSGE